MKKKTTVKKTGIKTSANKTTKKPCTKKTETLYVCNKAGKQCGKITIK